MSLETPSLDQPLALQPNILPAAKIHTSGGAETVSESSGDSSTSDDQDSRGEDLDLEMGNFLWDALTDYDPLLTDLADLCA